MNDAARMMADAAYVSSQTMCAQIEMQGMIAENSYWEQKGEPIPYRKEDFDKIILKYNIHHNGVVTALWNRG